MSQISSVPPHSLSALEGDPFRYGWRYIFQTLPDGTEVMDTIPLTLEDVLHPQEDDVIPENTQQERDRRHLHNVFEHYYADRPDVVTLSDCLVDWDVEGIRPMSADISVIESANVKDGNWGLYRIAEFGGRPLLLGEIVSPHTRDNDVVKKKNLYHKIGVPVYLMVDQVKEDGPRQIYVYHHTPKGYVEAAPDARGRYRLMDDIEVALEGNRLICLDRTTGDELGDYTRTRQQLEDEVASRREVEEQLEDEVASRKEVEEQLGEAITSRRSAEERATKAQEQANAEAEARERAEKQARAEAEARERAEKQARAEMEERQRAEERARQQAEALARSEQSQATAKQERLALEARLRELEELLRQRSGS